MKIKIAIAVAVCLLILAQILYSVSRRAGNAAPLADANGIAADTSDQTAGSGQTAPVRPAFATDNVEEIVLALSDGKILVDLRKPTSEWTIANLNSAPADAEKIDRFLRAILSPEREGAPLDLALSDTGLDIDPGLVVKLKRRDGGGAAIRIGLPPAGRTDAVYARDESKQDVYILSGDIRGELGLWGNRPGLEPKADAWLQTRVLTFDPARATALEATYPDHKLEFSSSEDGVWALAGAAPGGVWDRDGIADWLAALADFRITGVAGVDDGGAAVLDSPSHRLRITLGDTVKTVRASPNRGGDGMWVETSDFPGRVFHLPMWRFRLYFQRLESLFPKAAPVYDPDDILTLDIRRGGDSVKLINRGGAWQAAIPTHPLRRDRIARLAKLLAEWKPEDYADADDGTARPAYGGPRVEVVLANGDVYQYRLGGRHPVFPWRYVSVNGTVSLSAANAEATLMFPGFADIMDLGTVFPGYGADSVVSLDFTAFEPVDAPAMAVDKGLALHKNAEGVWEAETDGQAVVLTEEEAKNLVAAPLAWPVVGLYEQMPRMPYPHPMYRLRIQVENGAEHNITLLVPQARDIPFENGGDRVFLIDRSDFSNWLTAIQDVKKRIAAVARKPQESPDAPIPAMTGEAPREGAPEPIPSEDAEKPEETSEPEAPETALPDEAPPAPDTSGREENEISESADAIRPDMGQPKAAPPSESADSDPAASPSDSVSVSAVASEIEAPEPATPTPDAVENQTADGDPTGMAEDDEGAIQEDTGSGEKDRAEKDGDGPDRENDGTAGAAAEKTDGDLENDGR